MRVALDLRCVRSGMTGIGRYAANLALSLGRVIDADELDLITTPVGAAYLGAHVQGRIWTPTDENGWDALTLPDHLRRLDVDIFHSPLFVLPYVRVCKYVCTIHDVIPLSRPDLTHPDFDRFFKRNAPMTAKSASHIVAPSHHAKAEIVAHLEVPEQNVTAIHEPVAPHFSQRSDDECKATLWDHNLSPGYFLYVGALDGRKNLRRLLDAYASVRLSKDGAPPLVIVGAPSGDGYDLTRDISRLDLRSYVRALGHVPDADLPALYSRAVALVFPSLYEGFGLPVVEAMACGTPVITSDISSLPEVAGGAALLVDPMNTGAITEAMLWMLNNSRNALIQRGLARAAEFSLDRQGRELVELYERLVGVRT